MSKLTPEQRLQIVQFYFENNGSVRNTYRALRPFYRRQNRPSEQLIRLTTERFRTAFTLIDNLKPRGAVLCVQKKLLLLYSLALRKTRMSPSTINHRN